MSRKRYRPEDIIAKLREADVPLSQGAKVADVAKAIAIHEVTYYRWRRGVRRAEGHPGEAVA